MHSENNIRRYFWNSQNSKAVVGLFAILLDKGSSEA